MKPEKTIYTIGYNQHGANVSVCVSDAGIEITKHALHQRDNDQTIHLTFQNFEDLKRIST